MRDEHIKGCLAEARNEEVAAAQNVAAQGKNAVIGGTEGEYMENIMVKTPAEMTNWERVVAVVRAAFGEGIRAEDTMLQEVVLISNGKGGYRGIVLV